jgi:glutathione S-transferase
MTRLYYLLITKVGDNVIFESAVILEYIDEVYPPATLPVNALERADNRAWGVFAGELQGTFITLWKSKNKADIQPTIEQG